MRSPIILESNLIPGNYGALPENQYYSSPTAEPLEGATQNEDGTYTAPTYQLQSNKPTFDLDEANSKQAMSRLILETIQLMKTKLIVCEENLKMNLEWIQRRL